MSENRRRVGLLIPSSNTVMENDLHDALDKSRYSIQTSRMFLVDTTPEAERQMIDQYAPIAAELLGTARPDILVFGCTSAGSLGGTAYDEEVCAKLGKLADCSGLGVLSSVSAALRRRGLHRLAIITPYMPALTESVAASLADRGFDIAASGGLGIDVNIKLADPTPAEIADFTIETVGRASVDGIFTSCTNFRALEALPTVVERTGLPVVTSNSAVLEAIEQHFDG